MIYRLSDDLDIHAAIKLIGSEPGGVKIMGKKAKSHLFLITGMKTPAANILKQDALSIGAELAVPKGVITFDEPTVNAILICNEKQLEVLSKKELAQPFGLKRLAGELAEYVKMPAFETEIMGVLNINDDSFYKSSRIDTGSFIARAEAMAEEGADIIDIGAVSSRPGAAAVSCEDEMSRLKGVFDAIASCRLYEKITFSIDSSAPRVIDYALNSGFGIVNDITGLSDDEVARVASGYGARVCIMHMQGTPRTMQKNPQYDNVILEVDAFFRSRIEKAKSFGINDIILDCGVGFGKSLEHNLHLLAHQKTFLRHGYPLLVGASRKSMIEKIVPAGVEERLPGTLAIHLKALDNGASVLRVHDVKEHKQAIAVHKAITGRLF